MLGCLVPGEGAVFVGFKPAKCFLRRFLQQLKGDFVPTMSIPTLQKYKLLKGLGKRRKMVWYSLIAIDTT